MKWLLKRLGYCSICGHLFGKHDSVLHVIHRSEQRLLMALVAAKATNSLFHGDYKVANTDA